MLPQPNDTPFRRRARGDGQGAAAGGVQGYLAHTKQPPPKTLQKDSAQVPMVILGGGAVSYERCTPVTCRGGRCGARAFDKSAQEKVGLAWFEVLFTCTVHRGTSLVRKRPPP